jgi:chorismate dehydratase
MNRFILGTVPFLNSKPLIYPLEKQLIKNSIGIHYYIPSLLSDKLRSREVDMGLIPVAELLKNPEYMVFPGICISSFGNVDSVVLLSKKDIRELEYIALDKRSRSSTALLKIILEKFHKLNPIYIEKEINLDFLDKVDAGMLIGDAGLRAKYNIPHGYRAYDLGKLWTDITSLPFVYAVFAYYRDNAPRAYYNTLIRSKELGKKLINEIIEEEYPESGLSKEICTNYLSNCIKYDLGEREIEAINIFGEYLLEFDKDIKTFNSELKITHLPTV